jgi:hypothetical protein
MNKQKNAGYSEISSSFEQNRQFNKNKVGLLRESSNSNILN